MPTPGLLPAPSPAALNAKVSKGSSPAAKIRGAPTPRQKSASSIVQQQASSRSGSSSPIPRAHGLKSPKKGGGRQRSRPVPAESSSDKDEAEESPQQAPKPATKGSTKSRHRRKPSKSTTPPLEASAGQDDQQSKSLPATSVMDQAVPSKPQQSTESARQRLVHEEKELWDIPVSNAKTEAPTWQQSFFGPGKSSSALSRDDSLVGLTSGPTATALTWQQQSLQGARPSPIPTSRKSGPVKAKHMNSTNTNNNSPAKTRKQARRQSQPPRTTDSDPDTSSRQGTPYDQPTPAYGFSQLSLDDSPPPTSAAATPQQPQTPPTKSRKGKKSGASNITMTKPRNEYAHLLNEILYQANLTDHHIMQAPNTSQLPPSC